VTYADESPEVRAQLRSRVYYFLLDQGQPLYFATIRNRLGLTEDYARAAVDALVASGGLTLLDPAHGETLGRYRANPVGRAR
jgi:hypothetical protein